MSRSCRGTAPPPTDSPSSWSAKISNGSPTGSVRISISNASGSSSSSCGCSWPGPHWSVLKLEKVIRVRPPLHDRAILEKPVVAWDAWLSKLSGRPYPPCLIRAWPGLPGSSGFCSSVLGAREEDETVLSSSLTGFGLREWGMPCARTGKASTALPASTRLSGHDSESEKKSDFMDMVLLSLVELARSRRRSRLKRPQARAVSPGRASPGRGGVANAQAENTGGACAGRIQ